MFLSSAQVLFSTTSQ